MRLLAVAVTSLRQQARTPLLPLLTLTTGAFFVLLIWLFFPSGGSTVYPVLVVDDDAGVSTPTGTYRAGDAAAEALAGVRYQDGGTLLDVRLAEDRAAAEADVAGHRAVALIELPADFSARILDARDGDPGGVTVDVGGDLTNPTYPVAVILVVDAMDRFVQEQTGLRSPLTFTETPVGDSGTRTEFEAYVPGVLIFAIGLMIFGAAMSVAQEVESRTLHRLMLTPVTSVELLGGIGVVQLLLGLAAFAIALLTAVALGFSSIGAAWLALPIAALTCLSVIGLGLIVAAMTTTVSQAFLLANLPFGIFMFLSGTMFPVRGVEIARIGDTSVNLLDLLPPRHAVNALSSVFTFGSTDIGYELGMLTALSVVFYAVGAWLFARRHLRPARSAGA